MSNIYQNTGQNFTGNPYEAVPASPNNAVPNPSSNQGSQTQGSLVYASFFQRFFAAIIDAVLVNIVVFVISFMFGFMLGMVGVREGVGATGRLLGMIVSVAYYVYFTSQKGATLGKQALGLRVQSIETGQNLDMVAAFLREVVGKFISFLVLCLGYLWMLWDPQKQTWHDKIARSIVVKVK